MQMRYLGNGDIAMRTGRPKLELLLADEERLKLQSFARSRSLVILGTPTRAVPD